VPFIWTTCSRVQLVGLVLLALGERVFLVEVLERTIGHHVVMVCFVLRVVQHLVVIVGRVCARLGQVLVQGLRA